MNRQVNVILPIPIMEEIISFSALEDKISFRVTCKQFLDFITNHFFPTFTTTLYGTKSGYGDEELTHAQFNGPTFGALDSSLNNLYVSDCDNHVICKIDLFINQVTILCGTPGKRGWKDGAGSEARFYYPQGLALDEKERTLYVSDSINQVIRSVSLVDGTVSTIVGNQGVIGNKNGFGKDATLYFPKGLALDSISNFLYVVDTGSNSIRRVLLKERRVETLCGTGKEGFKDGPFEEVLFNAPCDIALNLETQELYVADLENHVIRLISLENRTVKTLCGIPGVKGYKNGSLNEAKFRHPRGLALDAYSQCLYVNDNNHIIRKISLLGRGKVTPLCRIQGKRESRDGLVSMFNYPTKIIVDPHSRAIYVIDYGNAAVRKVINKTINSLL